MIYFKETETGEVYAYPQEDVDKGLVKEGLVLMTPDEIAAHLNPVLEWWTDGTVLVKALAGTEGWRKASEEDIAALLPGHELRLVQEETARLRKIADDAIAPLQDAVDIDEATAAEEAKLKLWKKYRVALNRLPDQVGYPATIDWPVAPE